VSSVPKILVIQTAFIGDVILTLPLVQVVSRLPAQVDFLVIPQTAELLRNHPAVHIAFTFDKRGLQKGIGGFLQIKNLLKKQQYAITFVPHRSLRSALLARLSGIPTSIGFDASAGAFLFTRTIHYDKTAHEVERNLSLLAGLNLDWRLLVQNSRHKELPRLYPSDADKQTVDAFFLERQLYQTDHLVAVAPGSVWNTKRWLEERFVELIQKLTAAGLAVLLIGGKEDAPLCERIEQNVKSTENNLFLFHLHFHLSLFTS
jgi:heptosyltransferase-2